MAAQVIVPHRGRKRKPLIMRFMPLVVVAVAAIVYLSIRGCQTMTAQSVPEGRERVTIAGEHFFLEPALDMDTRVQGLGGRESIEPNGGMIFVFPMRNQLQFVMRDCLTAIDIAFLDDSGRVVRLYEMPTEPPRGAGESMIAYEGRLKKYRSDYPVRYVVEVAPGTWQRLGVRAGDQFDFDREGLKARAR